MIRGALSNQFGIAFKEYKYAINTRSDMIHSCYICAICNHIYLIKKSMEKHYYPTITKNGISYEKSLKYLLKWVSYHELDDMDFKGFLWCINKTYNLPSEVYKFSDVIVSKIYQKLKGKKVSLLIDSVKQNNCKYQGQIIYIPEQLYFIELTPSH